ncbi:MAG: hypothetical protein P1U35_11390 [Cycloclasticus sp.]|jgi:hypothetical protein|nr:hypothetical protein [Cycloclasticus sp.]
MTKNTLSLADKKSIIIDFLQQCNEYSEGMLKKYESQLAEEETKASAPQKIHDWSVYRDFNNYAINELKGAELDDWLD